LPQVFSMQAFEVYRRSPEKQYAACGSRRV